MTEGRRFRIPAVVDNCTHECLALVADTSAGTAWVSESLIANVER